VEGNNDRFEMLDSVSGGYCTASAENPPEITYVEYLYNLERETEGMRMARVSWLKG
jgi:hypothetical protein